jgi:Ser/Thr protein kinase RdoA (MazF antagonist)
MTDELLTTPPVGATVDEAVEIALTHYGLSGTVTRLGGERDDNFRIATADSDFALKIANPADRPSILEMQQLALDHIASADPSLPIPSPVLTIGGDPVGVAQFETGVAAVRVVTFIAGSAIPDGLSTGPLRRNLGNLLARLDQALQGFEHPEQDRRYWWDVAQLGAIRGHIHHLTDDRLDFVSRWLDHFDEEVEPRISTLPSQVIHSDFNSANLIVEPAKPESVIGVIDFADVIRSARVIDPAVAVAYQSFGQQDPAQVAADFVGAYHQIAPLTEAEMGLMPDLITARLVQSLAIGAWRAELHPGNRDYILSDADPAWRAIQRLDEVGTVALRNAIHDACEPQ